MEALQNQKRVFTVLALIFTVLALALSVWFFLKKSFATGATAVILCWISGFSWMLLAGVRRRIRRLKDKNAAAQPAVRPGE